MPIVTTEEVRNYLGLIGDEEDYRIDFLVEETTAEINRAGGRSFDQVIEDCIEFDSGGTETLCTHQVPIVSLTSIVDLTTGDEVDLDNVVIDSEAGLLQLRSNGSFVKWPGIKKDKRYQVTYAHGYETCPGTVRRVAMDYIVARFERIDATISSTNEGGRSVSYEDAEAKMVHTMEPYRPAVI